MAKQKGIIPLVGTIGGINFYYLNGKPVARRAGGGFNSKAIKSKASMQRVRENGVEFGHCSRVNKAFRQALRPFYLNYRFTFFHSRLMTLFTSLKQLDSINYRGERRVGPGINTNAGEIMLKQFSYTPDCEPQTVLPFDFMVDWDTYTLTVSNIMPQHIVFAKGATHLKLQFGVLDFDFDDLSWSLHLAAPVLLSRQINDDDLVLPLEHLPAGNGKLIAIVGVRYYQAIDNELYILNSKTSIGIGVVEVK